MPKREPFKRGRGRCIFCGKQPPEVTMSKEHVFADWLRDYIPRELTQHTTQVTLDYLDKEEISEQRHTGDPHARRVRCVCKPCNEGWMSQLQEAARPFLVPILTGKQVRLHRRAQTVLAGWVSMTIMVGEHVRRDMVAVSQAERDWLYRHKTAPKVWRIWLATGNRRTCALHFHRALIMGSPEKEIEPPTIEATRTANTQASTICFGKKFVVHAMSSSVAWNIIRRWNLPRIIRDIPDQIWPIRMSVVSWPKTDALNDAGITLLADNFYDAARRLMRDRTT